MRVKDPTFDADGFDEGAPWVDDAWDAPEIVDRYDGEPVRKRRRLLKWLIFLVTVVTVAVVLTAGGIGMWVVKQVNPPGRPGDPITFTVQEGDTLELLSARLKEQEIITHAGVFEWYVKRQDGELELVPGYYTLRPLDTMGNLLAVLRTPPAETYTSVTFPEGFTLRQMAARLTEEVTQLNAPDFLQATSDGSLTSPYLPPGVTSLEGMLFPDTYQVAGSETVDDVIERMIDLMELVGSQEGLDRSGEQVLRSPYEVLIIASIIEREAKLDEDRAKIARVIYNRLELGMPLQVDATLFYGQDADLSFDELKAIDSPYNTYLYTGLPPTPIANPGRASIRAALNPALNPQATDPLCRDLPDETACQYLYYVLATEEGGHAFAVTFEQHEFNIAVARERGILE
jgi:UPF0755 protein